MTDPTNKQIDAVLAILREEEAEPFMVRIRDFVPDERLPTEEERQAFQAADREAEGNNRAFAVRIARAVLDLEGQNE